ncbi:MAG: hypothetical protein V8Q32_04420 [Anaerotignum faecicola]
MERAILEGGGKNVKAILALLDMEEISYDAKERLKGLDIWRDSEGEHPGFASMKNREKRKGYLITRQKRKKERNHSGIPQRLRQNEERNIVLTVLNMQPFLWRSWTASCWISYHRLDGGKRGTGAVQRGCCR